MSIPETHRAMGFPLQACEQDSLLARWETKKVHASRILDDMEGQGNWVPFGICEMGYTSERCRDGRQSLRLRNSMRDEAHYRANRTQWGSLAPRHGGHAGVELRFATPQDWSAYNRISLWVYVHPTTMPVYSFSLSVTCEGAPKHATSPRPSHFVQDLKPGEWNHILWEIPNLQRDRVTAFGIGQLLRGHEPEQEGIVTYDFDHLELQQVDADKDDDWEPAPGTVAFCHSGYRPADPKVALLGWNPQRQPGDFEVVAADGAVVYRARVEVIRNRRGSFGRLDFSQVRTPGHYRLRCGEVQSRPFAIGADVWLGPVTKAMNFFFCQRCGYPVPGIHGECHQDVLGFHGDLRKCVNGGWHDAGDLSQGLWRTGMSVFAMLRLSETLGPGPLRDLVLAEAAWGLKWILKTRFGDGFRTSWSAVQIYTDNRVGTIDDVTNPATNIPWENYLASAVQCVASALLAGSDAALADQALAAAVEDWEAARARAKQGYQELAWGASASVLLYRRTGEPRYASEAKRCAALLLECQERRFAEGVPITGYFCPDTARTGPNHYHHAAFEEAPLIALRLLCEAFPEDEDWINWYAAAAIHSRYFLLRGSAISSPFHHLPNSLWRKAEILAQPEPRRADMLRQFNEGTRIGEEYSLRTFPIWVDHLFHGNTHTQLSQTWALAESALLRGDAAAMQLVGRQLEWVFGANPFAQSLMYGEGYDFAPQFVFCLKNLVGSLPVGMDCMRNDAPNWGGNCEATYKEIWVEPVNRFLGAMSAYLRPMPAPALAAKVIAMDREAKTVRLAAPPPSAGDLRIRAFNARHTMAGSEVQLTIDDVTMPWVVVIDSNRGRCEVVGSFTDDKEIA